MDAEIMLAGKRFGRLLVTDVFRSTRSGRMWQCVCDCGTTSFVRAGNLRRGQTKSCGCIAREMGRDRLAEYKVPRDRSKPILGREAVCKDGLWYLPVKNRDVMALAPVDEEDAKRLQGYCWNVTTHGYADAALVKVERIKLHHAVMGKPPKGFVVDHIDRDKLNNRRENLRFVTPRENSLNSARFDGKEIKRPFKRKSSLAKIRGEVKA